MLALVSSLHPGWGPRSSFGALLFLCGPTLLLSRWEGEGGYASVLYHYCLIAALAPKGVPRTLMQGLFQMAPVSGLMGHMGTSWSCEGLRPSGPVFVRVEQERVGSPALPSASGAAVVEVDATQKTGGPSPALPPASGSCPDSSREWGKQRAVGGLALSPGRPRSSPDPQSPWS